jgi:hypothetical protein
LLFDQEGEEEEDFLDEYGNIRPARNETSLPVRYSYVLSVSLSFFHFLTIFEQILLFLHFWTPREDVD